MAKVIYINGDSLNNPTSASGVLGQALHQAMKVYFGGGKDVAIMDEADAIKTGFETGFEYIKSYVEAFIDYTATIPTKEKMQEKYAFTFHEYIKDIAFDFSKVDLLLVEKKMEHKVSVEGKILPIPLKGYADLVFRIRENKRVIIWDHKFTGKYSDEEAIDGGKLVQAAFMFLLVYSETGEKPYSIIFNECKNSKNKDGSKQTKPYEIVYEENPLIFELFYRLYGDITDALLGKQVYIPNFASMFDKEVSILAYIHRLDIEEEKARKFKEAKIDNITDFLKQKVQSTGAMKKYFETVNRKFISATTLNYKDMKIEDQIRMKLMQFGIAVDFEDKIVGHSVELYRFTPSVGLKMSKIEGYVKDIEQVVEMSGVRVLAPIPNSGMIGFEVPKKDRTFPALIPSKDNFEINIGVDVMGNNISMDIREAPHMLVAGSSGSGKSVFLHSIINQLKNLSNVELYLFDPKQVEFSRYANEVEKYLDDTKEISDALKNLVEDMEKRYTKIKKAGARSIVDMKNMPYKFIIIDEYADLVMRGQTERNIQLLAQKGRACGIHIIIATQRASTKIISGDTKVNFPSKVVFRMSKSIDSRIMLDEDGAEKLLGKGDMIFTTATDSTLKRLQGYNI